MENKDQQENREEKDLSTVEAQPQEITISQEKLDQYIEQLKQEQNLPMGLVAGLVSAIVCALIWAAITVSTEYQIGIMAIALGLGVGFAIRYAGKGLDQIFGISGALFALFGCLLGNFFSIIGFIGNAEGLGYFETLSLIDFGAIPSIMMETFNPMDLLFYGIAVYEGYKFSFRELTEEEIITHAAE